MLSEQSSRRKLCDMSSCGMLRRILPLVIAFSLPSCISTDRLTRGEGYQPSGVHKSAMMVNKILLESTVESAISGSASGLQGDLSHFKPEVVKLRHAASFMDDA